jgi:hypothetical protein
MLYEILNIDYQCISKDELKILNKYNIHKI